MIHCHAAKRAALLIALILVHATLSGCKLPGAGGCGKGAAPPDAAAAPAVDGIEAPAVPEVPADAAPAIAGAAEVPADLATTVGRGGAPSQGLVDQKVADINKVLANGGPGAKGLPANATAQLSPDYGIDPRDGKVKLKIFIPGSQAAARNGVKNTLDINANPQSYANDLSRTPTGLPSAPSVNRTYTNPQTSQPVVSPGARVTSDFRNQQGPLQLIKPGTVLSNDFTTPRGVVRGYFTQGGDGFVRDQGGGIIGEIRGGKFTPFSY
jgi:hypothetical protein